MIRVVCAEGAVGAGGDGGGEVGEFVGEQGPGVGLAWLGCVGIGIGWGGCEMFHVEQFVRALPVIRLGCVGSGGWKVRDCGGGGGLRGGAGLRIGVGIRMAPLLLFVLEGSVEVLLGFFGEFVEVVVELRSQRVEFVEDVEDLAGIGIDEARVAAIGWIGALHTGLIGARGWRGEG